jgi:hypothetical protein
MRYPPIIRPNKAERGKIRSRIMPNSRNISPKGNKLVKSIVLGGLNKNRKKIMINTQNAI